MNWEQIKAKLSNHFTEDQINNGVKVKVYFNLHNKTFSVASGQGSNYGKVLFYSNNIILDNVRFSVGEKGRDKVLKSKRKNVHAFCYGTLSKKNINDITVHQAVSYNPYTAGYFYYINNNKKIDNCDHLIMSVINQRGKLWTGVKNETKE